MKHQTPCHMHSELKRIAKIHNTNNSKQFYYSCDSLSNIQFFMFNKGKIPEKMCNFSVLNRFVSKNRDTTPIAASGCSACAQGDYMYVFGGHSELGYLNTLYKLHLSTLQWELVTPESSSPLPSPRDKTVSWFYDKKYGFNMSIFFLLCHVTYLDRLWVDVSFSFYCLQVLYIWWIWNDRLL